MKKNIVLLLMLVSAAVFAQTDSLKKVRFVIGLSAPELLHTGINIDLGKSSQIAISAGIGPSWGTVWPTLNIEHRLYIGKLKEATNRRQWFFRQGATYFTAATYQSAVTLSVGADVKSKVASRGWTIDAGGFVLFQNERDRKNKIYPALRFQRYSYFKKGKK